MTIKLKTTLNKVETKEKPETSKKSPAPSLLKTSTKTTSVSIKNASLMDPKLRDAMIVAHQESSISNSVKQAPASHLKLTEQGVKAFAAAAERQAAIDRLSPPSIPSSARPTSSGRPTPPPRNSKPSVATTAPAAQSPTPSLPSPTESSIVSAPAQQSEDTRPAETFDDNYYDEESGNFSYASPTFAGKEVSVQIGAEQNKLYESEAPQIHSITFEDLDANGTFDQATVVFKRLYASLDGLPLFRELRYEIFRKSIFDDALWIKIETIESENFENYRFYQFASEEIFGGTGESEKYLRFVDKNIVSGKVYAYRIVAVYDGFASQVREYPKKTKDVVLENGKVLHTSIPEPQRQTRSPLNQNAHVDFSAAAAANSSDSSKK